ncbi:MAG: hypothetical protein VCG02_18530 [Verrucomicrobiota bacterium]
MVSFVIFLIWLVIAGVFGALFLALTILVVTRLLRKKPINLRPVLVVQATSILVCLATLTMAAKTAVSATGRKWDQWTSGEVDHLACFERMVESPAPAGLRVYHSRFDWNFGDAIEWVYFGWEDPAYLQVLIDRYELQVGDGSSRVGRGVVDDPLFGDQWKDTMGREKIIVYENISPEQMRVLRVAADAKEAVFEIIDF